MHTPVDETDHPSVIIHKNFYYITFRSLWLTPCQFEQSLEGLLLQVHTLPLNSSIHGNGSHRQKPVQADSLTKQVCQSYIKAPLLSYEAEHTPAFIPSLYTNLHILPH